MQKSKLGISVGLLGAVLFFGSLFSGYTVSVLLAGYILLREENEWLRKSAVKAVVLLVGFSLASAVLYLIPNVINVIDQIVNIFGGSFYISFIARLIEAIKAVMDLLQKLLFLCLGLKALTQGTIAIPVVDNLIEKYM